MVFRKYENKDKGEVADIFSKYWTDEEFLDELSKSLCSKECYFYVATEGEEVLGVVGLRNIPKYLSKYSDTDNPVELYVIASKYQNKGSGSFLLEKIINEVKDIGFTEILCYSPETHRDSWDFYERQGFLKSGIINDPDDGYPGMLWIRSV